MKQSNVCRTLTFYTIAMVIAQVSELSAQSRESEELGHTNRSTTAGANTDSTSPRSESEPHSESAGTGKTESHMAGESIASAPEITEDTRGETQESPDIAPADEKPEAEPETNDESFDPLLDLSLEELLDTEVTTASKRSEKLSDAPGLITVVTKEELRRFGGNTLKDILNRVPSLITSTTYFADRATIAARGDQVRIDSGHILILIDGRPTREVLQGGVASEVLEAFPVSIIDHIEVIKGPGSVLYGSNAFSAVINIITETGTNGTTLRAMAGVPFSHGEFAKSTVTIGDLQLLAAGTYLKRADWQTTYRYVPPGTVDVLSEDITIPNERAGAYFGLRYKGFSLGSMFNQWIHPYFHSGTVGNNTWRRAFGDLGYELTVSEALQWEMAFHATYTFAFMTSSDDPNINRWSHDIVGEWTNAVHILDNLRLVVGGLYNHIKGKEEADGLIVTDGNRPGGGFYAQLDYQPLDILSLIAGMQLNKIKGIGVNVVPRGGIILQPIQQLNIKLLYGQAYRAPSINELSLRETELWGNPNLKPERVQTVDAGVSYLGERINLGVSYFFTQQKDIIMKELTPSDRIDAPSYYDNIGKVQFQGVEFEGKYYLLRTLYLTGSFLYFFSKDGEGNKNVTPIANLGVKGGLSYMDENGITASLFYIFQGKLDEMYNARSNPSPKAYHLLNCRLSFDFAAFFKLHLPDELALFAEGENLLNQRIYLPDWGGVQSETIPVNPGRTIYFGISGNIPYNQ